MLNCGSPKISQCMKDWKETERGVDGCYSSCISTLKNVNTDTVMDIRKACYGRITHDTPIKCCIDAVKTAQLWIITSIVGIHGEQPHTNCMLFTYLSTGFFWQVRPFPGILQADRNWMAARSQDRGTDNSLHTMPPGPQILRKCMGR